MSLDRTAAPLAATPEAAPARRLILEFGDTVALSERLALTQPIDMIQVLASARS